LYKKKLTKDPVQNRKPGGRRIETMAHAKEGRKLTKKGRFPPHCPQRKKTTENRESSKEKKSGKGLKKNQGKNIHTPT